ncbi:probable transcription factor At5g28040 [Juglans regia]|uniref:Probable transcription factor At5g28040 n=1 Tax=Juglans regia TaxID=51240 RepID=A0A6P9EMS5_JUGRE|nr:probable transcription factor At5g28040 [Juglans regia]
MLSSFVDWIVFSSSSSSSSSYSSSTSSRYDHEDNDQVIISAETENNDEQNDVILDDVATNGDTIPVGIAVTDASAAVTVAVPATEALIHDHPPPITTTIINSRKRRRIDHYDEDDDDILLAAQEEKKHLDDSRRPSHRLWTNEDEIQLLQGYLEHPTSRGNIIHHNDTALFYEQIGSKLQVGFNKNQLLDKLRRLKRKYRNALEKINADKEFSFKSAHDQAAFEISRKIWGDTRRMDKPGVLEENTLDDGLDQLSPTTLNHLNLVDVKVENDEVLNDLRLRKRTKSGHASKNRSISNCRNYGNNNDDVDDNNIDNGNATRLIEDTVGSCLSPWFKELLSNAFCPMPLSGTLQGESTMSLQGEEQMDENGREQRILELERYSKQLELVQDQIKLALQELQSNIRE